MMIEPPRSQIPLPAGMPIGIAVDNSGSDTTGYYAFALLGWADIPAYFKPVAMWEPKVGAGYPRGVLIHASGNIVDGENYFYLQPNGAGFSGSTGGPGFGNSAGAMIMLVSRGGSEAVGRQTFRHEWAHVIDYMSGDAGRNALDWRFGFITAAGGPVYSSIDNLTIVAFFDTFKAALPNGLYAKTSVIEWFAEFFSYIVVNDIAGYSSKCDANATVPGPITVKCVRWFNQVFTGYAASIGVVAPSITSATPAAPVNSASYSHTLMASGSARTWSVISGALPTGLTLNSTTGVISGTPTAAGSFSYTIAATNQGGAATQAYTTVVSAGSGVQPSITNLSGGIDNTVDYLNMFYTETPTSGNVASIETTAWNDINGAFVARPTVYGQFVGQAQWLSAGYRSPGDQIRVRVKLTNGSFTVTSPSIVITCDFVD